MSTESDNTRRQWNNFYGRETDFLQVFAQNLKEAIFNEPIKKYLQRALVGIEGNILDVGAGRYNDTYLPKNRRPVCVDFAHTAFLFKRGREVVADTRALPFAGGAFGAVLAKQVYSYMLDPSLLLEEMVRVLKPGGLFVLIDLTGEFSHIERLRKQGKVVDFIPEQIVPVLSAYGLCRLRINQIKDIEDGYMEDETYIEIKTSMAAIVGRKQHPSNKRTG